MIKKIKLGIFNILRHYVKSYVTGNLGKVVEKDDYLVCYVKKGKIKNHKFHNYITCPGIKEKDKELAKIYKLYKKVYYIFDDLDFNNNEITIFGYGDNSEIVIKNCKFNYGLTINALGNCTVDNCYIASQCNLNFHAKNLTFKNMDVNNTLKYAGFDLQVSFSAEENLSLENCNIGKMNEKIKVFLYSLQNINLFNTKIVADIVKCSTKTLDSYNSSSVKAKEKIEIEGEILNNLSMVAPGIMSKDEITSKRIELIDRLKNIRDKCLRINGKKVKKYEKELNNVSVKRVLKNKNV